ncbi:MAG: HAMP domain-containing sensor histidine kinase [Planctomycetota bacterium]
MSAICLAVGLNVATTAWGLFFLERQYAEPMRATETALSLLSATKRAVGEQHNLLGEGHSEAAIGPRAATAGRDDEQRAVQIRGLSTASGATAARLTAATNLDSVLGRGVPRYVAQRLDMAAREVDAALEGDLAARGRALAMLFEIHERIEETEARIVENADRASVHAGRMRNRVLVSVGVTLAITMLAGVLAVQLVRRWILRPIERLRLATERFAAGDLDYRVSIPGRDEVAKLGEEFNAMASTILAMQSERLDRERLAAFGAVTRRIVHNIKSPLGGIRMLSELAQQDAATNASREHLARIAGTVDRLDSWLRRLLDVTRPADIQPVELPAGRWLEGAVEALRPTAEGGDIELRVDASAGPEDAEFDPAHLEQAVVALVSNAIEATPAGGTVRVTAWSDGNGRWGVDVADGGPGVSENAAAELFEPYFTTKPGGSGIGLAMARKVARDHGGDAWLRDAGEGRGAVFAIELPCVAAASPATSSPAEA